MQVTYPIDIEYNADTVYNHGHVIVDRIDECESKVKVDLNFCISHVVTSPDTLRAEIENIVKRYAI